jgi:hypothetical protein
MSPLKIGFFKKKQGAGARGAPKKKILSIEKINLKNISTVRKKRRTPHRWPRSRQRTENPSALRPLSSVF